MDTIAIGTIFRNYYGEANYDGVHKGVVSEEYLFHSCTEHAKNSIQSYVRKRVTR